jgi:hypothetical protein
MNVWFLLFVALFSFCCVSAAVKHGDVIEYRFNFWRTVVFTIIELFIVYMAIVDGGLFFL